MQISSNSDNVYKVGTLARAKCDPNLTLLIESYKGRIYYCRVVGHPTHRLLAYFERELIIPVI